MAPIKPANYLSTPPRHPAPKAPPGRPSTGFGRLALGVAAGALLGGYGRTSYAGTCGLPGTGTYVCTGAANADTDTTQYIYSGTGTGITVTSDAGFGLDTTVNGGNGLLVDALDTTDGVSITTGNISAALDALDVYAVDGSGITIDTTGGDISGGVTGISGISLSQLDGIAITTGNVIGDSYGILAYSGLEGGSVVIDTTQGSVTGGTGGILATSLLESGDIIITTADVTNTLSDPYTYAGYGGNAAIATYALVYSGDTVIDTTGGTVTGADYGIAAVSYDSGDITITTADVTGTTLGGIATESDYNGGATIIDTTAGTITGGTDGITAYSGYGSGDITITTADVTGGTSGSYDAVRSYSYDNAANTTIDTTAGDLVATDDGVDAFGYRSSGDITIMTGDITAGDDGVEANTQSYGGNIFIDTVAGTLNAADDGIDAYSQDNSGGISITTGNVTAGDDAIDVRSYNSSGGITIDATAGALSAGDGGIEASSGMNSGGITIRTADVTAGATGILVDTYSTSGRIDIDTTAGTVDARFAGISASAYDSSGPVGIKAGDVVAGDEGISVRGTSVAEIGVVGSVVADVAIDVSDLDTGGGVETVIRSSGRLEGTSGVALNLGDGRQQVEIFDEFMAMASAEQGIFGTSVFGGGDDLLTFTDTSGATNILYDGSFGGLFDGGDDTDKVNFSVDLDNLVGTGGAGPLIELLFGDGLGSTARLSFRDFEFFTFADAPNTMFTASELRSLAPPLAPIPLPPGAVLLGSAAMGLAALRRRRKAGKAAA